MKEILKKLRNYEIRIRKAITSKMQGDFHSVFKGSGLEFDDVRPYQYGDDVRAIDWNVSAKGHGAYIKTFKEEKEQSVFFVMDVSSSQEIGKPGKQKLDIGREICGVLALSAIKESSQVGLICFSDQKEKFIKPGKGVSHGYKLLHTLFNLRPLSQKTDLKSAINFTRQVCRKRSVIIFISDFIDTNYQESLKALARKNDLVIVHLFDNRETQLPGLGFLPLLDKENGKMVWVNTSGKNFRAHIEKTFEGTRKELEDLCRKLQVNYLPVNTDEDYVPALIKLFRIRNKSRRSA
jgi:uncharacterized protein (DUF58 family)